MEAMQEWLGMSREELEDGGLMDLPPRKVAAMLLLSEALADRPGETEEAEASPDEG